MSKFSVIVKTDPDGNITVQPVSGIAKLAYENSSEVRSSAANLIGTSPDDLVGFLGEAAVRQLKDGQPVVTQFDSPADFESGLGNPNCHGALGNSWSSADDMQAISRTGRHWAVAAQQKAPSLFNEPEIDNAGFTVMAVGRTPEEAISKANELQPSYRDIHNDLIGKLDGSHEGGVFSDIPVNDAALVPVSDLLAARWSNQHGTYGERQDTSLDDAVIQMDSNNEFPVALVAYDEAEALMLTSQGINSSMSM